MQISDENSIQDLDRELCVTCINDNSDKVKKPIKNYFDLFINTSLNHMSIRSCLVSQSNNNKSISNNIKLYNAMDLLPITFGIMLFPKICGEKLSKFQIKVGNLESSKVLTFKILLDSGASAPIAHRDVLDKHHQLIKNKKNKWFTMVGTFNMSNTTVLD